VDGPGAFGIFTTGSFGDSSVIFNSTDGLPDTHSVPLGTHAHANWGFAKQGVYRLTFEVTATLAGGQTVTDTETYTFTAGDADSNAVTPGGGGTDAGGAGRTPGLAATGATGVLPMAAGGVVLLGLGGVAVLVGRRKRENR
jgi:surface-anchored protein/LPXTG-motif cell wall-anchored protein